MSPTEAATRRSVSGISPAARRWYEGLWWDGCSVFAIFCCRLHVAPPDQQQRPVVCKNDTVALRRWLIAAPGTAVVIIPLSALAPEVHAGFRVEFSKETFPSRPKKCSRWYTFNCLACVVWADAFASGLTERHRLRASDKTMGISH